MGHSLGSCALFDLLYHQHSSSAVRLLHLGAPLNRQGELVSTLVPCEFSIDFVSSIIALFTVCWWLLDIKCAYSAYLCL